MTKYVILFLCLITPQAAYSEGVGLAILALQHPKFPVRDAVQVLRQSKRPAFAFLYRTFGTGQGNIKRLISGLAGHPYVDSGHSRGIVYVSCGPCRPPRRPVGYNTWAKALDIARLNLALKRDTRKRRALLASYRREVARVKTITDKYPHIQWTIVPELEDNLTNRGRNLLMAEIVAVYRDSVRVVANPLRPHRTAGVGLELHSNQLRHLQAHDIRAQDMVSLDGVTAFPSLAFGREVLRRRALMLLWRPNWQGIYQNEKAKFPKYRSYKFQDKQKTIDYIKSL
jgi:hypothetical protein